MELGRDNICYLTVIIFMIPLIVLSAIILCVKIKTSNLKRIINSSTRNSSNAYCYDQTDSFINNQKSDENYSSLHSYLKSFIPL